MYIYQPIKKYYTKETPQKIIDFCDDLEELANESYEPHIPFILGDVNFAEE